MRIQVKNAEHDINIVLPTGLLCNRLTAWVGIHVIRNYTASELHGLSPEKLAALFAEIRRIKAVHGRWELVDVQSTGGEIVKVIL